MRWSPSDVPKVDIFYKQLNFVRNVRLVASDDEKFDTQFIQGRRRPTQNMSHLTGISHAGNPTFAYTNIFIIFEFLTSYVF